MRNVLMLTLLLASAPASALYRYNARYFGSVCGNRDVGSADCLNRVVKEHASHVAGGRSGAGGGGQSPAGDPAGGRTGPVSSGGSVEPHMPSTVQTMPDQPALSTAEDLDESARKQAQEKIAHTEQEVFHRKGISQFERGLADALADSYDNLQAYLKPRQASTNFRLQAEASSRLREAVSFPSEYQEVARNVGLRTNADVQSRAPEYVRSWSEDADFQDRAVVALEKDAARARLASKRLQDFQEKLTSRVLNMNSVGDLQPGSAAYPSVTGPRLVSSSGADSLRNGTSSITSGSGEILSSVRGNRLLRSPASMTEVESGISTASGRVILDPTTGKPATGESLRELLRRRLSARAKHGMGGSADATEAKGVQGERKSGYDQFFQDGTAANGAAENASKESGRSSADEEKPGFFLSGTETDKVVVKLMGSLEGSDSQGGAEVYGSADVSIFQRMTLCLRKAEARKKIGGQ